jgi:oligopeptide/dipeptide ABC transporter ATP-binding protein
MGRLASERGAAVVLITHNLGVVAEFCTSVQVMYAGRVVERAPVGEFFARPVHPYSEALLSSVPRPGGTRGSRLPSIPGLPPSLDRLPAGCSFEPRCPVGKGKDVCREQVPIAVAGSTAGALAECHFASERSAASAPGTGAVQP